MRQSATEASWNKSVLSSMVFSLINGKLKRRIGGGVYVVKTVIASGV
jgi:hypothetical protein